MAQTRMALICATALVGVVVCGATSSSQEPIRVTHEGSADLTGDGQPEHVRVTAVGARWDSLLVRLEIWDSRRQRLFYADEWSSKDWCGGPSYAVRDGTTEDWVRFELERHADPEFFRPGASRASRFGIGNRERPSAELIIDLYEQLWRARYGIHLHEHLRGNRNRREIMREFEGQVSEEEIQALHAEVGDGPDFIYHPHWDALYGIAWSERLGRFVMMLFIG